MTYGLCVIATHNVLDGVVVYGPFKNDEEAARWVTQAEGLRRSTWRILPLQPTFTAPKQQEENKQ